MRHWKIKDDDNLPDHLKQYIGRIGRQISQPYPDEISLDFDNNIRTIANVPVCFLERAEVERKKYR